MSLDDFLHILLPENFPLPLVGIHVHLQGITRDFLCADGLRLAAQSATSSLLLKTFTLS